MSTAPSKPERSSLTNETDVTGAFEVPALNSAATQPDQDATGAFDLSTTTGSSQGPANTTPTSDRTALFEQDEEGATAILPPASDRPDLDGTTVLPQAAFSAPQPSDATVDGGTGAYVPDNPDGTGAFVPDASGATGVYEPGSTQAPAKQGTVQRGAANLDATGAYDARNTGGAGAGGGLGGATRLFDAAETGSGAPGAGKKGQVPDADRCGRYVLKRFHAKGGMGEIWMAEDPEIGRSVALKRMLSHRPDQQRRFRVEAQVTGQLEHPGIVPIHELGINEQGQPFYVMKFVHGRTLQHVIDEYHAAKLGAGEREVEQFRLLQIFMSLCQTVAYAHSRGVLHRDLKPENVMLGPYGETLLLDWGIAKVMGQPEQDNGSVAAEAEYVHLLDEGSESETRAGTIMGSLSFMSPEVAQGKNNEVDQRSDVFLLGGILYTMLAGRPPRQGKNAMELIKQAQKELPPPPRKINPLVPRALDAICMKALALNKENRYPNAQDLAKDVQLYSAGEPVSAYPEGLLTRAGRWAKRHRTALTRTALAVLLLGLLAFGYVKYRQFEADRAAERLANKKVQDQLAEEKRIAEEDIAARNKRDEATRGMEKFHDLAEEARFYAATTDAVAENAPYFDPAKGEEMAQNAVAVATKWGPTLEELPLPDKREPLRQDLYDLLLLLAQSKLQRKGGADNANEVLALLQQAKGLRQEPSRGLYRLRSLAYEVLKDEAQAAADRERGEAAGTPTTAQDHFLKAEQLRTRSAGKGKVEKDEAKTWKPDSVQMEDALNEYREALRIDPNHFWSHFQMGRCLLALGRYPEAVQALGTCVALQPKAPWGYSVRGFALAQMGHYAEAERDLNEAVQLSDGARPPRLNRAVVYWRQGKMDKAKEDFDAVLSEPNEKRLIEAAFYRGQLFAQQGKVVEARKDFSLVVDKNPTFADVYLYRARIFLSEGEKVRALDDLTKFLLLTNDSILKEDSWEMFGKRGHLLRFLFLEVPLNQRNQPTNQALVALAVAELRKAVDKGADSPRVFDDLGTMLYHSRKLEDAIAVFTAGLKKAPKDVFLLLERAAIHDELNDHEKALADYRAACRADPDNAEAHSGLGYIRAVQKETSEAQQEAELALLHGADKHIILHNVACIYATLSQAGDGQALAHQEVAMALIRRAIQVWKRTGGLNEIELMNIEPAFEPLRKRDDFQALIRVVPPESAAWPVVGTLGQRAFNLRKEPMK